MFVANLPIATSWSAFSADSNIASPAAAHPPIGFDASSCLWVVIRESPRNREPCRHAQLARTLVWGLRGVARQAEEPPLPLQLGELLEHRTNAFTPFLAQGREVDVPLIEAASHVQLQAVPFVTHEIDGHADG